MAHAWQEGSGDGLMPTIVALDDDEEEEEEHWK